MNALFTRFPKLQQRLPHIPLADLPTPVERIEAIETGLPLDGLFVKRDDLTAPIYGGNKVRKLEFLLGQAKREDARAIMTFGGAGSNHALATAIYGIERGFDVISMLVPQPAARSVRRNLLMAHKTGAELHLYPDKDALKQGVAHVAGMRRARDGKAPFIIPPGGSSATGALGFVNAALELLAQVDAGDLPIPDAVYVAAGTLGTSVGLALGFALAGATVPVIAVRVTETDLANEEKARVLFQETNALLRGADDAVPELAFPERGLVLRHDYFGEGYGVYTNSDRRATRMMRESAGIPLEGVYTGKAFAALLEDAEAGRLRGKTALFWDTYNSRPFPREIESYDYRRLPDEFHSYFEETGPATNAD